jgi:hypothetical protein
MTDRRPRTFVYGGPVPLWLLLFLAPLGLLFLTSLIVALALVAGAAAVAAFFLPRWWRRPPLGDTRTIELDQSQYHRIESRSRHEPH